MHRPQLILSLHVHLKITAWVCHGSTKEKGQKGTRKGTSKDTTDKETVVSMWTGWMVTAINYLQWTNL